MLPGPVGPNQQVKSLLWTRIPAAATPAQDIHTQPFQNPETSSYPFAVPVQLCTGSQRLTLKDWVIQSPRKKKKEALSQLLGKQVVRKGWEHIKLLLGWKNYIYSQSF